MATTHLKTEMKEKHDRFNRDDRSSEKDREGKEGDDKRRTNGFYRKKICRFCSDQDFMLDYKDVRMLQLFISEHGKIVPRRISGNCAFHQRRLTTAVKRARNLALVGYVSMGI